jgi:hypothetical protein
VVLVRGQHDRIVCFVHHGQSVLSCLVVDTPAGQRETGRTTGEQTVHGGAQQLGVGSTH